MSMIFPGMDPYLEHPDLWPGLHSSLIVYIRDQLQPQLRPRYVAAIDARVFIEGTEGRKTVPDVLVRPGKTRRPLPDPTSPADEPVVLSVTDVEVSQSFIHIRDRATGRRVVTAIEVLSPSNKFAGPGRDLYLAKQRETLDSDAHLVEIDLLRAGPHILAIPELTVSEILPYDYLSCVNRAYGRRSRFELYPRTVRQRLPRIRIPLTDPDPDVTLDLQAALERSYEAGAYQNELDYDQPCVPPLRPEDQAWAASLIHPPKKRKRKSK